MPTTKVKVFFFTHWQLFFSTLYYASFPIWLVRVLFLFSTFILHLSQFFTACQSILPFFYHPILPLSQLFTAYQSTLNIFYPLSCIFPNFLQLIQLSLFVPSSLHLSHIFTACQSILPFFYPLSCLFSNFFYSLSEYYPFILPLPIFYSLSEYSPLYKKWKWKKIILFFR